MCVGTLRYPACNAHVPYCHLWPARLYGILPHYLTNGTIFEKEKKKSLNIENVFRFSLRLLTNTFLILKTEERYDQKRILTFVQSARYSCPILTKLEFSRQIYEKYTNIKFQDNPSSGSRVLPYGQTDRHDSANSSFSQFC